MADVVGSASVTRETKDVRLAGVGQDEEREHQAPGSMALELPESDTPRGRFDLPNSIPPLREISPLGNESLWSLEARIEAVAELSQDDYHHLDSSSSVPHALNQIRTAELNDSSVRGLSGVAGPAMQRVNAAQKALARLERS